tara:strand:+ start:1909 stop:2238 length:330 start_codon:yes stop_codon:yes gene_type:complete
MPIANCTITPEISGCSEELIALWASESGISSEHMTINIVTTSGQVGSKYAAMATLLLPSLWSDSEISSLQLGLARALAQYYAIPVTEVHVVTTIVPSGRVVESGREVEW